MIEKKEKTLFNYRYHLVALLVMLTVLSSLAVISSRHNVNNAAVSPSSRQVIAKPMIEIVNSPLYNPDFFIAPLTKKVALNKKEQSEKILKKNTFYKSSVRIASDDTNNIKKQPTSLRSRAEANPVLFVKQYDRAAEYVEKNIEVANAALDEVTFPVAAIKEQEIALAEEQLKELAKHLFEKNKTLINQNQGFAEVKAAFDQLKTIKIQLNAANQINSFSDAAGKFAKVNQLRMMSQFAPFDIDKLQLITKELQIQTDKAEKQRNRASEKNRRSNYNNNFEAPEEIYHLPFPEKPQSFSFDFSAEQKVKVAVPNSFYTPKRGKKANKTSAEEDDRHFRLENPSPFTIDKSAPKVSAENDNLLFIRI